MIHPGRLAAWFLSTQKIQPICKRGNGITIQCSPSALHQRCNAFLARHFSHGESLQLFAAARILFGQE
jgi:hypothetical protein